MPVRTCNHLKEDGIPCGSPALRRKKLCFYHQRDFERQRYIERIFRQNDPLRSGAALPKTLLDMQVRLWEVMTALSDESLSVRRAGKLLAVLQQASIPLREAANKAPKPL